MGSRFKIEDDNVKCPFYMRESSIEVKCEGLCGTHTVSTFASKSDKEEYKDDFCIGYYWNCPLHLALKENYE